MHKIWEKELTFFPQSEQWDLHLHLCTVPVTSNIIALLSEGTSTEMVQLSLQIK